MKECLKEIERCGRQLSNMRVKLDQQVEPVREMQKVYQEKMTKVENFLYDSMDR